MGLKPTNEFRQGAVRIALTSRLTRKQVADDLGVGSWHIDAEQMNHSTSRQERGFEGGFETRQRE